MATTSRPQGAQPLTDQLPIMSMTYTEILQQIEELKAEASRLKHEEVGGVIARIKEAIVAYSLTPADLGFGGKLAVVAKKAKAGKRGRKAAPAAAPRAAGSPKFRDANGNVWGGRGPRPRWLREALLAGKSLQDFAA